MSKVTKTLIGFAAIFLLLLVFTGSSAILLVAASIICTAGVGLVVWIPLSYGVGSLIVAIFQSINSRNRPSTNIKSSAGTAIVNLTNDQKALTDYIHQSRSKGVNDNNIFSLLKSNGWAENAIHEAFGLVATHKEG